MSQNSFSDMHEALNQPIESSPRPSVDFSNNAYNQNNNNNIHNNNSNNNIHRNSSYLHESLVTQNFTEEDESAFSFPPNLEGGDQPSWFSSLLSCTGAPRRFVKTSSLSTTAEALAGNIARNRVVRWVRKSVRRRRRNGSTRRTSTAPDENIRQEFG